MNVIDVMDCAFGGCMAEDTLREAAKRIVDSNKNSLIVVDNYKRYFGILRTSKLLENRGDNSKKVKDVAEYIEPLEEFQNIKTIKNTGSDVIPVVNKEMIPVGVVSLGCIIDHCRCLKEKRKSCKVMGPKYTIDNIIGESEAIRNLKKRIIAASKIKSTVLIMGETGVGKELVANAIVSLSKRRYEPWVRINCAAIPENLLESELFGYEQGSFTGAIRGGSTGKFEIADGGSIFLDEIGDMKLDMQAKILRVLQENEIEKIGGSFPIAVDTRVIAATHENLSSLVNERRFRKDLFYRLNVIPINIPPLRAHKEDLSLLTEHFISEVSFEFGIEKPCIEKEVLDMAYEYDWPGNIREFRNFIEMMVSASSGMITAERASEFFMYHAHEDSRQEKNQLKSSSYEVEKETIRRVLKIHNGNKNKAAESLGISRSTLYNKINRFNIKEA
ncbi:Transcriptional regulator containing PAS, AAA-type ATPase, and DNA-binding Fis domains [Peptoclostridium litorale DSM 5388]|uniref:Signal-transduction and transcriptional-control protein Stc n=1 Tax=Peptoclostridium litorale DSM 5388 TaxID=1121324 RepID=A0A069RD61_PEPLI|nr:sigma-54-dependent Fis family transcriptional regulator [Peptoclostridium litorale]KDR94994.1 signal-transduction and transcriptional-control protein Stc [Peptoclostridium litorale DSM 5388]SIN76884.1 Transcriptional regulator containing PAS, AAA-type ATPase, and DNA-binding Fis domains [Peptoclostridium litorale DSM 5388]